MKRRGMTLIELLVAIGIVGVLIGLLLPAVQMAREAARRSQCQNNLRQLGLALLSYEAQYRSFPAGAYRRAEDSKLVSSWFPGILPFIEQSAATERYNSDLAFDDPANLHVAQLQIPLMRCPSSVGPESSLIKDGFRIANSSYHPVAGVHPMLIEYLKRNSILPSGTYRTAFWRDPSTEVFASTRASDFRDGMSNSWLLVESDGAPERWHDDHPHQAPLVPGGSAFDPRSAFVLHGVEEDGTSPGDYVFVTNGGGGTTDFDKEPFSFHPSVAHVLRADGGVDAVSRDIFLPIVIKRLAIDDGQLD